MIKRALLLLSFIPVFLPAAGRGDDTVSGTQSSWIFTSNYPLYFAAESVIVGHDDAVQLLWLFSEGEDPAFWEPSREALQVVQTADLLLFNGAGYEKWRNYAFLDESRIVDSSETFSDSYLNTGAGAVHSHGGGTAHSHGGTAFTLWMDLKQYEQQLRSVEQALIDLFPESEDQFHENSSVLLAGIRSLDKAFQGAGKSFEHEILLASHPVYQYFARAYLGEVRAMLWEPDIFPSLEEWNALEALKDETSARYMIWEEEPLSETRKRLEEMGLELIIIRPGFSMPESGDFMDILKANLNELQRVGGLI